MEQNTPRVRNRCIDFIKGIACIFVVCLHVQFPGIFGKIILGLGHFAVPFFFLISGYYVFRQDRAEERKRLPKKILHILILAVVAQLLAFVCEFLLCTIEGYTPAEIFGEVFSVRNFLFLVLFNRPLINGTLWFLNALLYSYLIFWVVNRFKLYRLAYAAVPVLMIAFLWLLWKRLAFPQYELSYVDCQCFTLNAWFYGFPFFMLGHFLHKREQNLKKIPVWCILLALCIGGVVSIGDMFWGMDYVLTPGNILFVLALFLFAVSKPQFTFAPLEKVGADFSMIIYIGHWYVYRSISVALGGFSWTSGTLYSYIIPIMTVGASILVAYLYTVSKKQFQKRSHS